MKLKRAVTIQDISCFGKCSLTVALPVLSAMGVETAVIPTAVLSTHTGGFKNFTFRDLTDDIPGIVAHWKENKIDFDCIYTGYLGSIKQIDMMRGFFTDFGRNGTLKIVDPVMGDAGKLYTGFTPEFAGEMLKLCDQSDIIVPNMTEASFMLGIDYVDSGYDEAYVKDVLKRLCDSGCKKAILTGVTFEPSKLGAAAYDSETDNFTYYMAESIPHKFHGTGDLFSSALAGALLNGRSLYDSCRIAADFVVDSIKCTLGDTDRYWYGVNFEKALPGLIGSLAQ